MNLVLSLFPGIGLFDRAFEEEGFCVVRGPDLLWGGDVQDFHPPAGRFDGVIGGPPCQCHSTWAVMNRKKGNTIAPDLIPEYSRCVMESAPAWFVMENVPAAPAPAVTGFHVETFKINNRELGEEQNRERRFYFGSTRLLAPISAFIERQPENATFKHCVRTSGYMKPKDSTRRGRLKGFHYGYQSEAAFRQCAVLQGLPEDFLSQSPFTLAGKFKCVGNGVPLALGRQIARAVRLSIEGADAPGCLKFG